MSKVTVVIEYDEDDYPAGVVFRADMSTEDLPVGNITGVYFGDALEDGEAP